MFAHEIILEKSGPLARVWLAAHWDKKLKKKDIFETKLIESVDNIINPKMKLALRTSGHLLLGVVKIYNRKTGFLYTDCNEAIIKLRSAFRPEQKEMTIKENKTKKDDKKLFLSNIDLGDIDDKLPDINDLDLDKNRARLEEITLREENDFLNADDLELNDSYPYQGDLAIDFNNEEMMRDLTEVFGEHQLDLGGHDTNFLGDDQSEMGDDHTLGGRSPPEIDQDLGDAPGHAMENYDNPMSVHMMEDTIDDGPMSPPPRPPRPETADSIMDSQPPTPITVNFGSIQEPMTPGGMSQTSSLAMERPEQPPTPMYHDSMPPSPMHPQTPMSNPVMQSTMLQRTPPSPAQPIHVPQSPQQQQAQRMQLRDRRQPERPQSTRSFVLEPTEHITPKGGRRKIRRQLTIDQAIGIDAETMRSQLRDHDDIVGRSVMAPPVEKILRSKEDTSVDKLFMLPISSIHTGLHQSCFISNCRPDLPACANLRIEQANVDSYNTHLYMDQQQQLDRSHDSDDDGYDYDDNYGGPPSVASYHEEGRRDINQHVNSQQNISHQDSQWDRAVNQMPNNMSNPNDMSIQAADFTLGSSMNDNSMIPQQKELPPPSPAHSIHDNLSMPPTPGAPVQNWGASGALSAAPSPMPMPESPAAAPSPAPSMGLPEPELPMDPIPPTIQQPEPSSSESSNYEPEPKRMRTASAEADFQEVEAGKGTAACIKLTQRLLMENNVVSLNQMAYGNNRKLAAQKFYSSLVMLKHETIEAHQNEPFGDIIIRKGSNFGAEILDHC